MFETCFRWRWLAVPALATALSGIGSASVAEPPAPAPVIPVVDDYFGTKVVDNYRWMEAQPEPQFRTYLEQQDAYARGLIARVPGRDQIQRDIAAIDGLRSEVLTVAPAAGRRFYLKRAPGDSVPKLYVSEAASGRETLLLDPARLEAAGAHASLDAFVPSKDGRRIAYVASTGGSEAGVLHVLDVDSGKALPDVIDRAGFAQVSWLPDGSGFFYTRQAKLEPGAAPSAAYKHLKVFLHRLGADPETDRLILDSDNLPFAFKAQLIIPSVAVPTGSDHALAFVGGGTQPELAIQTAPLAEVLAGAPAWRSVAEPSDGVVWTTTQGSTIYLLTHKDAPRFRVVSEALDAPGFASARTVAAERGGVLTCVVAASDALYLAERDGGGMKLLRLSYGATSPEQIATPFKGTIYPPATDDGAMSADPRAPGALVEIESWVRAPQWFAYDPALRKLVDAKIIPPFPRDLSGYDTLETAIRAPDGTMVPLSIVYKHGLKRDGARPTLLEGYGNFAVPMDPNFRPSLIAWLDRGGVFAQAHVRGGGELGEPWHRGGMLANKENSITDFIASGEALIAMGFTSKARLAGAGASGGGLTVGAAMIQRPDLFRVAVLQVPGVNPLRFEQLRVGPALVPEYGSVSDPEQVKTLLKVDPYAQVKDGTAYPAVLLTAGFNDPRILPWMPAKMTARLQAATSSGRPVLFRVEFDAGHGLTSSTAAQKIAERTDEFAFLLWQMGVEGYQPQ
jgi:prolyl oligopeptidase